jgi:hypothetical protein
MVFEDSQETEKKDLQSRLVMLESQTRQMELKTRNYSDQSESIIMASRTGGVNPNGRNTEKDITSEGLRIVCITWGWKTNKFTGLYCICTP